MISREFAVADGAMEGVSTVVIPLRLVLVRFDENVVIPVLWVVFGVTENRTLSQVVGVLVTGLRVAVPIISGASIYWELRRKAIHVPRIADKKTATTLLVEYQQKLTARLTWWQD